MSARYQNDDVSDEPRQHLFPPRTNDNFGGHPLRLSSDRPLAYKTGVQDFYGREFIVTPDVLIPRPETEQIIDTVLSLAGRQYLPGVKPPKRQLPHNPVILDVGTGSGCIAVTLALEMPNTTVYATDISKPALEVATKNAAKHGASITTIISHLLDKVKTRQIPTPDIVVANLPYVDYEWDWIDHRALSFEPSIALYADKHGLALILQLIEQASELGIRFLVLEADPCQHDSIAKYAATHSYELVEINGFVLAFRLKL